MKKALPLVLSLAVVVFIIVGAIELRGGAKPPPRVINNTPISAAKLAAANGVNGNPCYVAIDGLVYDIEHSAFWQKGRHVTSKGQASCGRDLSQVIGKSPHGKAVLDSLPQIGKLTTQ